jgi:tetratricopeptide (TPR) repeat protein
VVRRAISKTLLDLHREHKSQRALIAELGGSRSAPRLVLYGDLLREGGDAPRAAAAYEAAVRAAPDDPTPVARLADLPGRPIQERIKRYHSLIEMQPGTVQHTYELADLLFKSHDDAGATRALEQAAGRFETSPMVQNRIADLLVAHGLDAAARPIRAQAVTLEPTNVEYLLALASLERRLGHNTEAIAAYRRFLELAGANPSAYERLVMECEKRGFAELVRTFAGEALTRWPDDLDGRRRYAGWLVGQGDLKASLAQWNEILRRAKQPFMADQAKFHIHLLEDKIMLQGNR